MRGRIQTCATLTTSSACPDRRARRRSNPPSASSRRNGIRIRTRTPRRLRASPRSIPPMNCWAMRKSAASLIAGRSTRRANRASPVSAPAAAVATRASKASISIPQRRRAGAAAPGAAVPERVAVAVAVAARRISSRSFSAMPSARQDAAPTPSSRPVRRVGAAGRGAAKGADINASLSVSLEDIAANAKKRILLPNDREVEVNLPKGVSDGQIIRLRGLGGESPIGEPGDVLLRIDIVPHEKFTVEGDNLRHRLPVPLEDAILGATLRVPTLTGAVEMKIPPMSSSGRTFRMRGKGLPGKKQTGDLLVTLEIRL